MDECILKMYNIHKKYIIAIFKKMPKDAIGMFNNNNKVFKYSIQVNVKVKI